MATANARPRGAGGVSLTGSTGESVGCNRSTPPWRVLPLKRHRLQPGPTSHRLGSVAQLAGLTRFHQVKQGLRRSVGRRPVGAFPFSVPRSSTRWESCRPSMPSDR